MKVLNFPIWKTASKDVQSSHDEEFKPSTSVIRGYCADIDKFGSSDSDLPHYFRKCAEYFERQK